MKPHLYIMRNHDNYRGQNFIKLNVAYNIISIIKMIINKQYDSIYF